MSLAGCFAIAAGLVASRRDALSPVPMTSSESWMTWLWTNGVKTIGAAAKVMNFDRLGKRYALTLLGIF